MTVRANPFENQPDFWVVALFDGAGNLVSQTGRKAELAVNAPGVYDVTISPGVNAAAHVADVTIESTVGAFKRLSDISDTLKRISLTTNGNAAYSAMTRIRYVGWYCK